MLATAGGDKKIYLYNISTYVKINTLSGHTSKVNSLSLLSSGLLASASSDETVRIWNVSVQQAQYTLNSSLYGVYYAIELADTSLLVGGSDVSLYNWNLTLMFVSQIWSNFFSTGGSYEAIESNGIVIAADQSSTIRLINETTGQFYLAFNTPNKYDKILALEVLESKNTF